MYKGGLINTFPVNYTAIQIIITYQFPHSCDGGPINFSSWLQGASSLWRRGQALIEFRNGFPGANIECFIAWSPTSSLARYFLTGKFKLHFSRRRNRITITTNFTCLRLNKVRINQHVTQTDACELVKPFLQL